MFCHLQLSQTFDAIPFTHCKVVYIKAFHTKINYLWRKYAILYMTFMGGTHLALGGIFPFALFDKTAHHSCKD